MAAKKTSKANVSKDDLLHYYREMLLIRRFEEKAGQLYGMGLIGGFCHLYIGQEAVVVGLEAAAEEGDKRVTSYRDHGHMLACGMDANGVMAELTGRSGGYSKGKGGSMHMFSKEKHFYGGHGIVGAQVSLGAGLAFAHKYREDGGLCMAYFGDGAANQGQIWESANMASLWNLPMIFCIENNHYGMGTSQDRHSSHSDYYKMGNHIPGVRIDGMNVLAVKEGMRFVKEWVGAGNGPMYVEMMTYRYHGHSMSDPGTTYRNREEIAFTRSTRDPIEFIKILKFIWFLLH